MSRLGSACASLVLLASCAVVPDGASPPGGGAACAGGKCDVVSEAGSLTLEQLPARVAAVLCRHAQVCNATDSRLSILTEDECRAEWTETWNHRLAALGPSIRANRVVFDAERAQSRIDEVASNVAARRCLVDSGLTERHFFRGTIAEGESCTDAECVEGLSCVPESTYQCSGRCVAWPSAGPTGPCTGDNECMPEEGCQDGMCRALSPVEAGESCHRSAQCPSGLFCQPTADSTGRCEPPRADGESCDSRTICGRGRTCRIHEDGSHSCGLAPGDGDDCGGILVFCRVLGLVCDSAEEGVSRCRPMGREGESCIGGDCSMGLRCDLGEDNQTYPGVCRPARRLGEPCQSSEDCLGDWCGAGNVCVNQFGSPGCWM